MHESQPIAPERQPAAASPQHPRAACRPSPARSGFTLTELLIVIAIIAILAGLIAAAAVNALRRGRETRIQLEIKNLSTAIENFKNEYGAYPPNGMNLVPGTTSGTAGPLVQSDFQRMFKKAFPQHQEPPELINALCGQNLAGAANENLVDGMRASEALYFWLGGFSSDTKYPISGPGGPSFVAGPGNEVLEDRNRGYEFDLGRLGPRDDSGVFNGRSIVYEVNMGSGLQQRQINFWQFLPSGSEQPLVYFDVSRHKPGQYDPWAAKPAPGVPSLFAFKQLKEGVASGTTGVAGRLAAFVNQGKYQVLHAGLDDDWGDFSAMQVQNATTPIGNLLLFPDGPFIGPTADTLTNFTDGTLADASEE